MDADNLDKSTFDFDGIDVVDSVGEKLGTVDGFIIDVSQNRPYHVVVEGGHWYKHKHFLIPIGHVRLDRAEKRLTADVRKARAEKFPGFSRSDFEKLTDSDIDQMAYSTAAVCCDDAIDRNVSWASWTHYEYPSWWDASYYRADRDATARSAAASTAAATATRPAGSASGITAAERDRDRELVTAHGGETSPHLGGRAQPGDVIGVETGGEQTHIGDTAKDEDEYRRAGEKAAAKRRD